ncbi:hypothetical protein JOE59_001684 [Agromyces cerinus]|uniref:hypothetical protein n=1 Tax=Agromyces cerinus TaxID=33878 RepID=UPI00195889C4|nr:hypothetical protein [Agromyces cerinus]MBM7830979.1 hypothetical protein [Agromyces cerinus]
MTAAPGRVIVTPSELVLIADRLPGVSLPAFVSVDSTADDRAVALARLRARGLVSEAADLDDTDWGNVVDLSVLAPLAVLRGAGVVVQTEAWSVGVRRCTAASIRGAEYAAVTRTSTQAADDEVVLELAPIDRLWPALIDSLPPVDLSGHAEQPRPRSRVSTGIVEARALIDAIRDGDAGVIAAVASTAGGAPETAPMLRALARPLRAGFRLLGYVGTDPFVQRDWLATDSGWMHVQLTIDQPSGAGAIDARAIVETGKLMIDPTNPREIGADLLAIIATVVRSADVA